HEAGHVIFRPFGEFVITLGGTLGQLLVPAVLSAALLLKNRDPFGSSIGLWFMGVSLLDISPYVFAALNPKLVLLTGTPGEDGPHDWIYILEAVGLRNQAQLLGTLVHAPRRGHHDDRTAMGSHGALEAVQRSTETSIAICRRAAAPYVGDNAFGRR